jgi:gamma-glutamylputrescine oxidase
VSVAGGEGFNDGLGFRQSYYLATANEADTHPTLEGAEKADVVIVGGGCTGLSAAWHAAERGLSVVVLEGGKVGWGASGRNGGQIIPGLRKGAGELTRRLGETEARAVFDLALEARDLVVELIDRHAIDCDLRLSGHVTLAAKPRDFAHFAEEAGALARWGYHPARLLDAAEAREFVATKSFGGLFDAAGGHFHPLNYALGLASAAADAGVRIFEGSPAIALESGPDGVTVRTAAGEVMARHAILGGDALLSGLCPRAEARIMPVASYIAVTEPLDSSVSCLLPGGVAASDSRFVVNYYRLTRDNRLLFGGGERYSRSPPADIAAFVRPHLEAVFPPLAGVAIAYAWGGLVSITRSRLPHLARKDKILIAHGYSGMGAVLSTLAGKLMVEEISGEHDRFQRFAALAPPAFPGGPALRAPLHTAGMLWYALRDRL